MNKREKFARLEKTIDIDRMLASKVAIFGAGASMDMLSNLVRCGLGGVIAIDPDTVEAANVGRQGHHSVGTRKVDSARIQLQHINPDLDFTGLAMRHDQMSLEQWKPVFTGVDLFIFTTDSFECQAAGNRMALSMNIPALFVGVYKGGKGGEVFFWTPNHEDCFRCFLEPRYAARAADPGQTDPTSENVLPQDTGLTDCIAGHIAIGLLTQGAGNYFGGLIEKLGVRQFLQITLRHDFQINGIDPVQRELGVAADNDAYFTWATAARRNGPRLAPCPDCENIRGRQFALTSKTSPAERDSCRNESVNQSEPTPNEDCQL